MYGVLYAVSAEIFPANHRGTGNGLIGTATRVFGVLVRSFQRSCTNWPTFTYCMYRHLSSRYSQTLILPYRYTSLVDSSLVQAALRYCCRSSRGVRHPYKTNYDLVFLGRKRRVERRTCFFFCYESPLTASRWCDPQPGLTPPDTATQQHSSHIKIYVFKFTLTTIPNILRIELN